MVAKQKGQLPTKWSMQNREIAFARVDRLLTKKPKDAGLDQSPINDSHSCLHPRARTTLV